MIALDEIAAFLDACFDVEQYGGDTNGVYRPSARPVRRLGLALEPWPAIETWAETRRLDALFLHRPWKLEDYWPVEPSAVFGNAPAAEKELQSEPSASVQSPDATIQNQGVLAYHLPFDEHLTLGYNPRLADVLHISERAILGEKEGRPLGLLGRVAPRSFPDLLAVLDAVFGGHEDVIAPPASSSFSLVTHIVLMGAMTDALVREAHARGAQMYVTGQLRHPARVAVQETGMGVVAVGHRRSELWGLRALAGLLRERWSALEVVL